MARDALKDGAPGAESPSAPLLSLHGVTAGPPGRAAPVLAGVDLQLDAGQCGVLLGGNGSGKSTLLRTIAGLWPARAGTLRSPAEDGFDPRRVGLVLEDSAAQFLAATVAGELEFALENQALAREEILARRDAVLTSLDLTGMGDRDPRTLSPGEQARCLIAATLVLEPPVLLLDDAFLYLGPGEGRALWDRLRDDVKRDRNRALLLATHDGELAGAADRVGLLEEGRLTAWGPPEEVLRGPLPEAVEPPLAVWLEGGLRARGVEVPPGRAGADTLAVRLGMRGESP